MQQYVTALSLELFTGFSIIQRWSLPMIPSPVTWQIWVPCSSFPDLCVVLLTCPTTPPGGHYTHHPPDNHGPL